MNAITDEELRALLVLARIVGDEDAIETCTAAIEGNARARAWCAETLAGIREEDERERERN